MLTGIVWGVHHQDQLAATANPTVMSRPYGAAEQSAAAAASALTYALPASGHALYYTPEVNPERVDVPLLNKARRHIDAAFYSFTDKPIAEALLAAADRGVKVRIYRDHEQFEDEKTRNTYMTTIFAARACCGMAAVISQRPPSTKTIVSFCPPIPMKFGHSNRSSQRCGTGPTTSSSSSVPVQISSWPRLRKRGFFSPNRASQQSTIKPAALWTATKGHYFSWQKA